MVKEAKADGLPVTAEVCPHHFTLSTEDMVPYDTNYKMNPPLRTKADVEALRQGLKEDIMDVIAQTMLLIHNRIKTRACKKHRLGSWASKP